MCPLRLFLGVIQKLILLKLTPINRKTQLIEGVDKSSE